MDSAAHVLEAEWLGRMEYGSAWDLQKQLVAERHEAPGADRLLLLEHSPVYTLGRSGTLDNLLFDEARRRQEKIELFWVDRGGDITYHGPGQLVGYPIFDLKRLFRRRGYPRPDLHRYLRDIEEAIIRAVATFDVRGRRYEGYTGVWVDGPAGPLKIAAIGIKVSSRGVSSHGFALNVDPDLTHFTGIIPCGIEEHDVTSLSQQLGHALDVRDVIPAVLDAFSEVFELDARFVGPTHSSYNDG